MNVEIIGPNDIAVHTAQAPKPTIVTYTALQQAFDHLNHALFADRAPPCLITLQRKGRAQAYYATNKFTAMYDETKLDEIALNPKFFRALGAREIISSLAHEMVHQLQHHFGKPMKNGYHDRQWGTAMKAIGLWPSHTGKPGGRETGHQMSHYIVEGGPFAVAFEELNATIDWGDTLIQEQESPKPKAKRLKFVCPSCDFNALAVPSAVGRLACIPCHTVMVAA